MSYVTLGGEQTPRHRRSKLIRLARSFAAVALTFASFSAIADDWPTLRQGLWEYQRNVGPQKVESKRCLSPTEDMKRQNAMLAKSGCRITPVTRRGNAYTFGSECSMQGLSVKGTSVITADGDAAYTLDVDSIQDGKRVKERLVARRLGECR